MFVRNATPFRPVSPSLANIERIYRILRLVSTAYLARCLRPVPLPLKPTLSSSDASVVVPVVDPDPVLFRKALRSWLENNPLEILVVTPEHCLETLKSILRSTNLADDKVTVYSVLQTSKRRQLAHGIRQSRGKIVVLADGDVFWQCHALPHLLAPLEDYAVGGVGPLNLVQTLNDPEPRRNLSIWKFLLGRKLTTRFRYLKAISYVDGGTTCLAGRTAAYRGDVLRSEQFLYEFTNDLWLWMYPLDSGDDTFITRWMLVEGWRLVLQTAPEATISTIAFDTPMFLSQWLRWTRNSKRSFIRFVFHIQRLWWRYPYLMFDIVDSLARPFYSMWILYAVSKAVFVWTSASAMTIGLAALDCLVHYASHFGDGTLSLKCIRGVLLIDLLIIPIEIWSMLTTHVTRWGTSDVRMNIAASA